MEPHNRIVELIYEILRPERPKLDDFNRSLLDGTLDSLDFASLLMAVEDEFDVDLSETNPEEVNTIEKLAQQIESHS